jgi:VWFA-related protein
MSRERLRRKRLVAVLIIALASAVALAAGVAAVSADVALTTADVVLFLTSGISERTILIELHERGFGDPLDAAHEAKLREAGASETLIVALRRAAPAPTAAPARPAAAIPPARTTVVPPTRVEGPQGLTFSASARSVRVPVSVLDKRGQPVLGLRGEDFEISESGRKQAVTFFSGERRPLRIALALDVSTSMLNKIDEVSNALRHFIDLLEPADEIMVITFSGTLHVDQDFTSDREQLERVFSRLRPDQGTSLYDAAIEAIRRVAPGPAESKAVVLVTDGVDTSSRATFGELREIARRSEVPIFSLGLGDETMFRSVLGPMGGIGRPRTPRGWPGGGRGPRGWPGGGGGGGWPGGGGTGGGRFPSSPTSAEFDARPLLDLAEDTGGRAEILKNLESDHGHVDRLKEAVESIAMTLRHRYLVGYEPEGGKSGWRKIKVEVDRPSVTVQARKGYYTEG